MNPDSAKARKQRRAYFHAPKHRIYRDLVCRHDTLNDKKFDRIKRAPVRKGDTVMIRRGQKTGDKDTNVFKVEKKVMRVDYNRRLLYLEDLKMRKRGNKVADRPIEPRNVIIVSFDLSDDRRKAKLEAMQNPQKRA